MRNLLALFSSTELATLILTASSYIQQTRAFSFQRAQPANLDISQLGRVGLAGDFDAVSLYQWVGQSEGTASQNGSTALLSRYPNGAFATLQMSDGVIQTMCPFVAKDGTLNGVVVGGNFTSLGGQAANGIALFNTTTAAVVPLPGLNGSVSALYCDRNSSMVYVGGSFSGGNSSNAIAWVTGWTNLPFQGFNGPVTAITKAASGNIVFGGNFDGLGNTSSPTVKNSQVIPLTSANVTAVGSSTQAAFNNPSNIICKTGSTDGPGNTWLLQDGQPGSWTASFEFGFNPTLLRLYNTNQQGRGTKTWRFTALPLNGILNMSYIDPTTGQTAYCDATCPLPENNSASQDFLFVDPNVGMNSFRIDISDWYGNGGGLAGIELFQNDIYSFAINAFNEQKCDGVSTGQASSTTTGPWTITPSGQSNSEYLTASLNGPITGTSQASVVFEPNIKQAGNYSITVFTPGCLSDNTCATRGRVNITGVLSSGSGTGPAVPISTEIWQTNNYDKYDEIYVGHVDLLSSSFTPSVTLAPSTGQSGPLTVVAQKIRANIKSSTGGLNGLYEYNPNIATAQTDFSNSTIDTAGSSLESTATINGLITSGSTIYVAGGFNGSSFGNIFSIGTNASDLGEGGLNGVVSAMTLNNSALFMVGSFTGTRAGTTKGLSGVASYNISTSTWAPLGAGINGVANYVVPLQLNLTAGKPELALAISGSFTSVNAFGSSPAATVNNFAVWVPGRGNWLQNLNMSSIYLQGTLTAGTTVPNNPPLFAGRVFSYELSGSGAFELTGSGNTLEQFPITISATSNTTSPTLSKRAIVNNSSSGVLSGSFYNSNGLNLTILGGHFTATATNGSTITNLAIINGTTNDNITGFAAGVDSSSVIQTVGYSGTLLFAGGRLSGTVNGRAVSGLVVYDLVAANYASTQPAALQGSSVTVNAIVPQPSSTNVYVGGSFDSAGSFNCPSLCIYDTSHSQWNSPGNGLTGSVAAMTWVSNTELVVVGNLTAGSNSSTVLTYDTKSQAFSSVDGPAGTLNAVTAGSSDGTQYWVGGANTDGSPLLQKYNGTWASASPALGVGSTIEGLQVFTTTSNHASSDVLEKNNVLMVLGNLNITGYGNASAAIFNGTAWTPYALTSSSSSSTSLSQVFVQYPLNFFKSSKHHLAVGFVVLIALAIALGIIFLVVVAGILAERYRRRRDGYVPAPQTMPQDKFSGTTRIPPEHLFGGVNPANRPL